MAREEGLLIDPAAADREEKDRQMELHLADLCRELAAHQVAVGAAASDITLEYSKTDANGEPLPPNGFALGLFKLRLSIHAAAQSQLKATFATLVAFGVPGVPDPEINAPIVPPTGSDGRGAQTQ